MTPMSAANAASETALREWVARFISVPRLAELTVEVLAQLPESVRRDFVSDPGFAMGVYDPEAGQPVQLRLGQLRVLAAATDGGPNRVLAGRGVSLRLRLVDEDAEFARYVIAHELAHAYLRNVCGSDLEHVESAADGTAAEWGFPRPESQPWGRQFRRRETLTLAARARTVTPLSSPDVSASTIRSARSGVPQP